MFAKKIKSKSDQELSSIANNPKQYDYSFLSATLSEIKQRSLEVDVNKIEELLQKNEQKQVVQKKNWSIPVNLNSNIKIASNLIFVTVGLGVINMLFVGNSFTVNGSSSNQLPGIIGLAVVAGLGYILKFGQSWTRIVLLVLFIIGAIPSIALLAFLFKNAPIAGINNVIQLGITTVAMVLLFRKSTNKWYKINNNKN